jgi:hypothetical protein
MYKNFTLIALGVLVSFSICSQAYAAITYRSFGGRILNTTTPEVTCAAQYGLMTIAPVGAFPPGPFIIRATQKSVLSGGWILGLYNIVPDVESCYTNDPYAPMPVPTLRINPLRFNTSKFSL